MQDTTQEELKQKIRDEYAAGGISHEKLSLKYGFSTWKIGLIVNPNRALVEATRKRKDNRRSHIAQKPSSEFLNPIYDPQRDGVMYHNSITAELCGDPLPGRSALDQLLAKKREFV